MSDIILSGKREFDYDDEEKFFLTLMRIIFVVSALLFAWGVYSHWRQIDLIKTGQSAVGTVSRDGRHVSYTTGDGRSYSVNITGMLLDELEETVTVYYKENPAEAVPPTSIKFFLPGGACLPSRPRLRRLGQRGRSPGHPGPLRQAP